MAKFTHPTFLNRRLLAFVFLIYLILSGRGYHQLHAQSSLDDLLVQLNEQPTDKDKLSLYNELSREYLAYQFPDSAIYYAQAAIEIAEKLHIHKENIWAHVYLAEAYYLQERYALADEYYNKAQQLATSSGFAAIRLQIFEGQASLANQNKNTAQAKSYLLAAKHLSNTLQDTAACIRVFNQLATIYYSTGEMDSAQYYFESLIAIKTASKDTLGMLSDFSELGGLLMELGDYTEAQSYFFQARALADSVGDSMLLVGLYSDISKIYLEHLQWEMALDYAQQAAPIAHAKNMVYIEGLCYQYIGKALAEQRAHTAAQEAYTKALNIFKNLNNDKEIAKIYIEIGNLLEEEQQMNEALPYLQKALDLYESLQDEVSMMEVNLSLANLYFSQQLFPLTLRHAQKGYQLAEALKSLQGLQKAAKLIADAYGKLGNYPAAYQYQVEYGQYKDSVFNAKNAEKIFELETRYKSERKDRIEAELKATLANKERLLLQKNYQSYFLFGGILLLALGLVFVLYIYQKRQQLHKQNIAILKKEQETTNLRSVISGEEKERKRMAAELHDGLGATLVSAKMMFDAIENELPNVKEIVTYKQANKLLDGACEEVRDISHNLMPSMLVHYGLEDAVKELCTTLNQSHQLEVNFISFGLDKNIDETIEVSIYRIVQELLKNIVKHAEAQEAIVQLAVENNMLSLTVEDDGKGFELSNMNKQSGIGLDNLRSRVAYLQGSCEIDTRIGEGTTFHINIPLKNPTSK